MDPMKAAGAAGSELQPGLAAAAAIQPRRRGREGGSAGGAAREGEKEAGRGKGRAEGRGRERKGGGGRTPASPRAFQPFSGWSPVGKLPESCGSAGRSSGGRGPDPAPASSGIATPWSGQGSRSGGGASFRKAGRGSSPRRRRWVLRPGSGGKARRGASCGANGGAEGAPACLVGRRGQVVGVRAAAAPRPRLCCWEALEQPPRAQSAPWAARRVRRGVARGAWLGCLEEQRRSRPALKSWRLPRRRFLVRSCALLGQSGSGQAVRQASWLPSTEEDKLKMPPSARAGRMRPSCPSAGKPGVELIQQEGGGRVLRYWSLSHGRTIAKGSPQMNSGISMGQQRCLDSNCFGSFQPQNSNGPVLQESGPLRLKFKKLQVISTWLPSLDLSFPQRDSLEAFGHLNLLTAQQEQPVLQPHEEDRAFDLKLFFNSCIFFCVIALHGICLYNIENQ
ncbi:translation initiation factor IF-2 [Ahaetulla prasina]|uniref:translation initiation factor IF-2 n=1 Tax=Ahaetulla prasina TaxID=499056 RepID=UPI0026495183|nr:translation initiation factor IF-2 [Ahaetulla prasina]